MLFLIVGEREFTVINMDKQFQKVAALLERNNDDSGNHQKSGENNPKQIESTAADD